MGYLCQAAFLVPRGEERSWEYLLSVLYVWYCLFKIVVVQKQLHSLKLSLGCLGQYLLIRLGASIPARRYRPLEVATLVSVHVGGEMLP